MLNVKLQDQIPCSEVEKRPKIIDIIEYTKLEMGQAYSKNEGQYVNQTLHRVATKEREEDKGTTK